MKRGELTAKSAATAAVWSENKSRKSILLGERSEPFAEPAVELGAGQGRSKPFAVRRVKRQKYLATFGQLATRIEKVFCFGGNSVEPDLLFFKCSSEGANGLSKLLADGRRAFPKEKRVGEQGCRAGEERFFNIADSRTRARQPFQTGEIVSPKCERQWCHR